MAKSVNVFIDSFQATGQSVNFPQYEVDITINWVDKAGNPYTRSELVLFPNILNDAAISNDWLKRNVQELMLNALREIAGVDND